MTTQHNEPAFPCLEHNSDGTIYQHFFGMTLRDYFAAKALPSVLDQKDVHDGRNWANAAWISY
jgi:hypothetical protein